MILAADVRASVFEATPPDVGRFLYWEYECTCPETSFSTDFSLLLLRFRFPVTTAEVIGCNRPIPVGWLWTILDDKEDPAIGVADDVAPW